MSQPATDFVKMKKFHRDVQNAMMLPPWNAYIAKDAVVSSQMLRIKEDKTL